MAGGGDVAAGGGDAPLTVLLADDQPLTRTGVRLHFAAVGLVVAGELDDLSGLADAYDSMQPGVVVAEPAAADRGRAIAALAAFLAARPGARVLAFTSDVGPLAVEAALEAGCLGVVPKTASAEALVAGVRAVATGDRHLHPRALAAMLHRRQANEVLKAMRPLSAREVNVLQLVADGRSNAEIADALGLSDATVKTHVAHILRKLDATDRAHAVSRALRLGLLD